jgi:hypothetical protein
VIENDELQRNLIRKLRHILRPASERSAGVGIDPFEIVKKSRRRHMPRNPEARPVRHRSICLQEKSAFVIEDVSLVIRGRRSRKRRLKADTHRKKPGNDQAHDNPNFRMCAKSQSHPPTTPSLPPNRAPTPEIFGQDSFAHRVLFVGQGFSPDMKPNWEGRLQPLR